MGKGMSVTEENTQPTAFDVICNSRLLDCHSRVLMQTSWTLSTTTWEKEKRCSPVVIEYKRAILIIGDPALTCQLHSLSHRHTVSDLSLLYRVFGLEAGMALQKYNFSRKREDNFN
nr:unnamed protein product [Callosobruchus chinensis]